MKRTIIRLMPVLFAGMFVYGGCARQEVVKKDEPLAAPVAKAAETTPTPDSPVVATGAKSPQPGSGGQKESQQASAPVTTADLQKALERIYFDVDSATLSGTARQALTKNFEALKQEPLAKVRIEGHCDERGADEYNLALGERRARAAARYLTTLGISAERLSTVSYGKEKPADPGHDEAAWGRNRRDEFVIVR